MFSIMELLTSLDVSAPGLIFRKSRLTYYHQTPLCKKYVFLITIFYRAQVSQLIVIAVFGAVNLSSVSQRLKIKWQHFPRYWPFVRGIHRSPVNSPHKGQ